MPTERLPIPLLKGIDESIDDRMLPGEAMAKIVNGYFVKMGGIAKRNGFRRVTDSVVGGATPSAGWKLGQHGPVRGLLAIPNERPSQGEVVAFGARRLFAYVPEADRWVDRGPLSPCTGHQLPVFHHEPTFTAPDSAESNGFSVYAARQTVLNRTSDTDNAGTPSSRIRMIGKSADGEDTFELLTAEASGASAPHSPRVIKHGLGHVILFANNFASPATLARYVYPTLTPGAAPTVAANVTTDMAHDGAVRMYCGVGVQTTDYMTAYIDSLQTTIQLERWSQGSVSQATGSITGATYYRVATCDGIGEDDRVYVAWIEAAESDLIRVRAFKRATMGAEWAGAVTVGTTGVSDQGENLGVAMGRDETGELRVVVTWGVRNTSSTTIGGDLHWRSVRASDGGDIRPGAAEAIGYNAMPLSQPWWQDGRAYVSCVTTPGELTILGVGQDEQFAMGLMANCVVDLNDQPGATTNATRLAAAFDVGLGSPKNHLINTGNGSRAHQPSTRPNEWRCMAQAMSFFYFNAAAVDAIPSFGASEVQLDYREAPIGAAIARGAAIIGGGYFTWYAGGEAIEWGFLIPPVITSLAQVATGTLPLTISIPYIYQSTWEHRERGWRHRGVPDYTRTITPTANASATVTMMSLPFTHRDNQDMSAVVYRNSTPNGIADPARTNFGGMVNANTQAARSLSNYRDLTVNTQLAETIYVPDQVEAVMPDGGRIVFVVGDRVFTGDHMRKARFGFTKAFAQGSASDDSIVPEANEGFSLLVPDGSRIFGGRELDGRAIGWSQEATYIIAGSGPDNAAVGNDYVIRKIAPYGCIDPRSVVNWTLGKEDGGVFFQSQGGLYQVSRALRVEYIGAPVEDSLAAYPTITSAVDCKGVTQLRFTCNNGAGASIVLVFDYSVGAWSRWEPRDANGQLLDITGGAYLDGEYWIVTAGGIPYVEDATTSIDAGATYADMEVETGWIRLGDIGGYMRTRYGQALLRRVDGSTITLDILVDYATEPTDSLTLTTAEQDAQLPDPERNLLMAIHGTKCEVVKLRMRETRDPAVPLEPGRGPVISGFAVEVRKKAGRAKLAEAR
jgi:hypothetical protein